ncbi:hypothetical protein B566_EDAN014970 [Ephemera danica]|nr:hypothetical protein B566_EDAN014970 [Ephemera danica]
MAAVPASVSVASLGEPGSGASSASSSPSHCSSRGGPGLYEFLIEAELQHYYSGIRNDLKFSQKGDCPQTLENVLLLPDERAERPPVKVPNKHIIPAEAILVNKELGTGEFGVVQQGVWANDGEREAAIMHAIDHEHIVRLYGVVLDTCSLMLVTELAPLRSLLECLKEPSLRSSFPVLTLCDFAIQICDGMQYLEFKRLIHRALVTFCVLARCAPECITFLRFTSASDVWAYGVTLWEMFSYGFQPWAALTGQQILEAIDEPNFQRLEQADCCPKDYYSIMLKCWQHDSNKRPKFSDLIALLPECKPEQVQAAQECSEEMGKAKRDQLQFRIGDVITVLDKNPVPNVSNCWKGVLNNGKTGIFNPAFTVAYLGSNLPSTKSEFTRGALDNIPEEEPMMRLSQSAPPPPPLAVPEEDDDEDEALLRNDDHVSYEDLLEFACDGPNARRTRGPAHGPQSDEVRIMGKVLGKEASSEDCVLALDATNWDVHRAIKVARLQALLGDRRPDMAVACEALGQCNWDVARAAEWVLADLDDSDTTEV